MRLSDFFCLLFAMTFFILASGHAHRIYFRPDYTYFKEHSIFYKFHHRKMNYSNAVLTCHNENAQLFYPSSVNESKAMLSTIKGINNLHFWIGAHHLYGVHFTLSGHILDEYYSNWGVGEPNNKGNKEECVEMRWDTTFNDEDCSTKQYFACESTSVNLTQNAPCQTFNTDYFLYRNSTCYTFHPIHASWRHAIKACTREGSRLAIINNDEEVNYLVSEWQKRLPADYNETNLADNNETFIHLGFSELLVRDMYITLEGKNLTASGYDKWSPGRPIESLGRQQRCGGLTKNGTLIDVDCKTEAPFFCEMTLKPEKKIDETEEEPKLGSNSTMIASIVATVLLLLILGAFASYFIYVAKMRTKNTTRLNRTPSDTSVL